MLEPNLKRPKSAKSQQGFTTLPLLSLGPLSLLFFLPCTALCGLTFTMLSLRLLLLGAGGADISWKLPQTGPSLTNTNLALIRGLVMVQRVPTVGLTVACM